MEVDETTPAGERGPVDTHAPTNPLGGVPQAPLEESPNLPPGRYVHLGQLGKGGMGVIYRVRDLSLGREVALKKLHAAGFQEPERLRRFERETRAAAALDHPHIVRVLDVGVLPDRCPYYTMDLLTGMDVTAAVKRNLLSVRQAVEAIRQVAEAAHYAHQHGILHRDIKPGNVWLKKWPPERPTARILQRFADAAVKHVHALLLDFGLAKFVDAVPSSDSDALARATALATMTQSGQLIGTPSYMAPEQALATRDLDARVDVYGLGATLYHAVTGRPPFVANSILELVEMLGSRDPVSPRAINHEVDRDLETLILRCLQKKPEDRYATAEELADDCARWLGGESIAARPVGLAGRAWRRLRRSPGTVAVLVAIAGVAAFEHHRASEGGREARTAQGVSREALGSALEDVAEGYLALRRAGDVERGRGLARRVEVLSRQLQEADASAPEAWYHLGRIQRRTARLDEAEASLGRAVDLARGAGAPASARRLLLPALYERGVLRALRSLDALIAARPQTAAFPLAASADPQAAGLGRLAVEDLGAPAWTDADKEGMGARIGVCWGTQALLDGRAEGAAYLARAVGQDPGLEDAWALLGRGAELAGRWEEAADWYAKGRRAVEGASGLLRDRARALTRQAEELEREGKDAAAARRAAEADLKDAEELKRAAAE